MMETQRRLAASVEAQAEAIELLRRRVRELKAICADQAELLARYLPADALADRAKYEEPEAWESHLLQELDKLRDGLTDVHLRLRAANSLWMPARRGRERARRG